MRKVFTDLREMEAHDKKLCIIAAIVAPVVLVLSVVFWWPLLSYSFKYWAD